MPESRITKKAKLIESTRLDGVSMTPESIARTFAALRTTRARSNGNEEQRVELDTAARKDSQKLAQQLLKAIELNPEFVKKISRASLGVGRVEEIPDALKNISEGRLPSEVKGRQRYEFQDSEALGYFESDLAEEIRLAEGLQPLSSGKGTLENQTGYLENLPFEDRVKGNPITGKQGSAAAVKAAQAQAFEGKTQQQIDEYNRVYGSKPQQPFLGYDPGAVKDGRMGVRYPAPSAVANQDQRQENYGMAGQQGGMRGTTQMGVSPQMTNKGTMVGRLQAEEARKEGRFHKQTETMNIQSSVNPSITYSQNPPPGTPPAGGTTTPGGTSSGGTQTGAGGTTDIVKTDEAGNPLLNFETQMANVGKATKNASFQSLLQGLPPEVQGALAPWQGVLDAIGMTEGSMQSMAGMGSQIAKSIYDGQQSLISTARTRIEKDKADTIKFAEESFKSQAAVQQKLATATENLLRWEETSQVRKMNKDKDKKIDSMLNSLSIRGGIGSGGGIMEIEEADVELSQAIDDLKTEYTFKRVDAATKISGKISEAGAAKDLAIREAWKAYNTSNSSLDQQGFTASSTLATAQFGYLKDFVGAVETARKEQATAYKEIAKEARGILTDERTAKRNTENDLWKRLFDQRAQDGNLNPELTKTILKDMEAAGVDISNIDPNNMTIEQMNEKQRILEEAEKSSGKIPLSKQVDDLKKSDEAFYLLDNLKLKMEKYAGVGGPMGGMTGIGDVDPGFVARGIKFVADVATGLNVPFAEEAAERQREAAVTFAITKQVIGKAMEGGVLRKEDEVKYNQLIPNLRDTDRIRERKLTELRGLMEEGRRALLDNMRRSGYNTTGYDVDSNGKPLDPLVTPSSGPLTNDEADDIIRSIEEGEPLTLDTLQLGTRSVKGHSSLISRLERADADFFKETGQHIQVNQDFRSHEQQKALFEKSQRGEIGRAAPPGKSFHEKGLAIDVTNWEEAQPYLRRYGLLNELEDDRGHFSFGEFRSIASSTTRS